MKKQFSTAWKASSQPRKQRKYIAKAPLHIKRKLLSVNLAKELRKKYGQRNIVVRKGDTVKIMKGKFKNKVGKIITVFTKQTKVTIEGILVKKQDGSKVNVKLRPSNLQITELNTTDKTRKLGKISIHSSEKQPNERMKNMTEEKNKKTESKVKGEIK